MTDHDTYRELSAGFVLGVLDAEDRRAFESHLDICAECRREVASFAPIPGLLARSGGPHPEPLPQAVADRAAAGARSEWTSLSRSRTRWRLAGTAAAVAAMVMAALLLWPGPPRRDATVLAVEASVASGEVTIEARPWGTAVHLELEGLPQRDRYVAWVIDDSGDRQQVATWGPTPAGLAFLDGASSVPADRVTAVVVTDSAGSETMLSAVAG